MSLEGETWGVPNAIFTILAIDAVVISLFALNILHTNRRLVGAKVIGTTALVGASMLG